MNANFKYTLQPGSKKHICPACGKKTFVRYIDTDTKEYLSADVGRCDREINCSCHNTPAESFEKDNIKVKFENRIRQVADKFIFDFSFDTNTKDAIKKLPGTKFNPETKQWYIQTPDLPTEIKQFANDFNFRIMESKKPKPPTFLDIELVCKSLNNYSQNNFVKGLYDLFSKDTVLHLIERYFIGTENNFVLFPQIDENINVRTAKRMQYKPETLKRTKKISWLHPKHGFNLKQCFFGLHQIRLADVGPDKTTIGIVESEKTAIIMTGLQFEYDYMPDMIWLASGQMHGINVEKMQPIKDFQIILYPDLSESGKAFRLWNDKADEYNLQGFSVTTDTTLEDRASPAQRKAGYDIADFVLNAMSTEPKQPIKNNTQSAYDYLHNINADLDTLKNTFDLAIN